MHISPQSSVFERVVFALEQTTSLDGIVITPETQLRGALITGRLHQLKLALYLEESFDIELPDEALERFSTVADVIKYMNEHDFEDYQ